MDTADSASPRPGVSTLLLEALESRWETYRKELEHCRSEFSNDAVHDLRVATRRILALIGLLNAISPRRRLKKMRRSFKKQLDEFDELRDTQVILEELAKGRQSLPQLQEFQAHLHSVEEKLLKSLHKKVKKFKTSKITKRIRKTGNLLQAEKDPITAEQTLQAVDHAFLRTQTRLNQVDLTRPATIHRVRVAFKSFRYMVEIVHPLLPGFPEANFKQMNQYQTLMGNVQDAEVFMQTFERFAENASLSELEPVRRYYEERHAQAIAAYAEEMNTLPQFWRPALDQLFPWENQKSG